MSKSSHVTLCSTGGSHPTCCLVEAGNNCPHRQHSLKQLNARSPSQRAAPLILCKGTGVTVTLPAAATLQQVQEGALYEGGVWVGGRLVEAESSCLNGIWGKEEGNGWPLQWGWVSKIYLNSPPGNEYLKFISTPSNCWGWTEHLLSSHCLALLHATHSNFYTAAHFP